MVFISKYRISFFILCIIFLNTPAWARPVSYPGGWTVMQMNDGDANSLHIHYSPTKNYSLGYRAARWRADDFQTHSIQLNNLIKRWNKMESQANFYIKSGVGVAYDSSGDQDRSTEPHAFSGVSLDWEDRRYFIMYENSYHYSGDFNKEFNQHIMGGIAPYIGEYGDLHTWLMLKVEHSPEDDDHFTLTPHVRFFKGVNLVEIGLSEDKDLLLNFVVRF